MKIGSMNSVLARDGLGDKNDGKDDVEGVNRKVSREKRRDTREIGKWVVEKIQRSFNGEGGSWGNDGFIRQSLQELLRKWMHKKGEI